MEDVMLGIDIGATGIKGAIVDVAKGELITEKIKYKTPKPATPDNVLKVVKRLLKAHKWQGSKMGLGFPSIIKSGVAHTASNIDNGWINLDIVKFFRDGLGIETTVINDADVAGIAEMQYGSGKNLKGTVLMLTLGTGIGSGLFIDGKLVPNVELGHLRYKDSIAEHYAANSARLRQKLSWPKWGKELNLVLEYINHIISPDTIIFGGGVSKKYSQYKKYLKVDIELIPAQLLNNAGIIGAAYLAATSSQNQKK